MGLQNKFLDLLNSMKIAGYQKSRFLKLNMVIVSRIILLRLGARINV